MVFFLATVWNHRDNANTPIAIQEISDTNLLGAIILWLIVFIFNPWYYVICFLDWLFQHEIDFTRVKNILHNRKKKGE